MVRFLALLLLLWSPPPAAAAATGQVQTPARHLLELELALAGTDRIYAVFDLPRREIHIKAKGLLLLNIPLAGVQTWGNSNRVQRVMLAKRSSSRPPLRKEITPGRKETEGRSKALEVTDMPVNFTLHTREGSRLRVIARPQESFLSRLWHALVWELAALRWKVAGRPGQEDFTSGMLRLAPGDARALYWYFPEGAEAIIVPAGTAQSGQP